MNFSIWLPIDDIQYGNEFVGQQAVIELAQAAEDAGFQALNVSDHPCPTGRWLDHGGHHAQDPFIMLAMAAAVTSKIKLQTGIIVLPYRNPFLTARAVACLDANSNGRAILGIGAGYLKGEYKALGVEFEKRNELTDEYLRAIKTAWTQDEFTFEGSHYQAMGNRILPRPLQDPHPPIWIGGNAKMAIRRAAEHGDAWCPFTAPDLLAKTARTAAIGNLEDLTEKLDYLREYEAKIGRKTPTEIVASPPEAPASDASASELIDAFSSLKELGVTWVSARVSGTTRSEWCDNAQRFGEDVVAKMST